MIARQIEYFTVEDVTEDGATLGMHLEGKEEPTSISVLSEGNDYSQAFYNVLTANDLLHVGKKFTLESPLITQDYKVKEL